MSRIITSLLLVCLFIGIGAPTPAKALTTIPVTADTLLGPLALTDDTVYESTNGSNITFGSTVDGAYSLTVNTAGAVIFDDVVGGTTMLTGLTVASWNTALTSDAMTSGSQSYSGAVTLGQNVTLFASNVDLSGGVTGAGNGLTIVGNATLGAANGLSALQVSGNSSLVGNISSSGTQNFAGAVALGSDVILTSGAGAISFGSSVNGTHSLTVNTSGAVALNGITSLNGLTSSGGSFVASGLDIAGNLSVTSTAGNISQSGVWTVVGTSTIDAGIGTITLSNAGNNFIGAVSLAGGMTQVTDANALTLGTLNTGALTVISTGALSLGGGAVSGNLAVVSNNGAISQSGAMSVTGTSNIDAGTGTITLTNPSNDFAGAVTTNGNGVRFTDSNDLSIASLTSGANGSVSLIAGGVLTLPSSAIDTGTADLTLESNGGALAMSGALSGANVTLSARDGLAINQNVTATGVASLSSGSTISRGGGAFTANTLTGSSVGNTTLTGTNYIGALGSFSAAGFSLANTQALAVIGPVNGGTSTALTTTAGDLAINGAVGGTTTMLTSAGNITEGAGGAITAGALTGSSVGNTTLTGANHIGTLGSFNAANFALTNAQALVASGPLTTGGGTGDMQLTTTSGLLNVNTDLVGSHVSLTSANDLTLTSDVTGTTVNLAAGGNISQSGGELTAGTFAGSSTGSTWLTGTNHIGTLGSFSAAGFSLTNAQALAVNGPVNGGASTALTTTTGNLAINGTVNGTSIVLTSAGDISQSGGGLITAGTGTINAASGAIILANPGNSFLGPVTANGSTVSINNSSVLALGPVSSDGGLTLVATDITNNVSLRFGNGATTGIIGGNYSEIPAATLSLSASASSADQLAVSGTANLAGALNIAFASAPSADQAFTVLTATGVSGTFATSNITGLSPSQTPVLSYTPTSAILTIYATPTITGISPSSGTTAGGTSVTITGTGFTDATAVDFGTTAASSFTVDSATQITAITPAGSGAVDLSVTTPGGTSATSPASEFAYQDTAVVTLTATPNPSYVGNAVIFTATVQGNLPTGSVTFCDGATTTDVACTGGTVLCPAVSLSSVINPTASCTTTFTAFGSHSISAFYSGDSNFTAATTTSALLQTILASAVLVPMLDHWTLLLLGGLFGLIGLVRAKSRTTRNRNELV